MLEYRDDPRALMRARTSTRSYRRQPLPADRRAALQKACGELRLGPLGTRCRFLLLDREASPPEAPEASGNSQGERLGTYGVIRGASTYLAGAAARGAFALPDYGYLFELLILKATDLRLGTCWLGGTLRRSDFDRALGLREDEILPAVSPVGIPARRRSLIDRLFRLGAGSGSRRPWEALFFDRGGNPLTREQVPEAHREALEMVRLAPSASNRQPWRGLLSGAELHLFLRRTPGYRAATGVDLQRLDIGIAMAHFELTLEAAAPGRAARGRWEALDSPPEAGGSDREQSSFQNLEYVVSWRPEE